MNYDDILGDPGQAGIYQLPPDVDALEAAAADNDFALWRIDLAAVRTKQELLDTIARELAFPEWFGGNWDALEDCLGDLSWRPQRDRVLLIEGFESLASVSHDDFRVLLDLLADVAEHWSAQGRVFLVLFVDPEHKLGLRSWGDAPA